MSKRAQHHAELIKGLANQTRERQLDALREPQRALLDAGLTQGPPVDAREPQRMLNEAQLLTLLPFGRTTLFAMIKRGAFPRAIFASPGRKFWFSEDVARWQMALREHDHFNPERPRRGGRRKAGDALAARPHARGDDAPSMAPIAAEPGRACPKGSAVQNQAIKKEQEHD